MEVKVNSEVFIISADFDYANGTSENIKYLRTIKGVNANNPTSVSDFPMVSNSVPQGTNVSVSVIINGTSQVDNTVNYTGGDAIKDSYGSYYEPIEL